MADFNQVQIIGRLTRDPELRTTAGGHHVGSFGIATSRKYKGSDGQKKEETTFVDVTVWGRLAEIVSEYCKKGRQIFISGRLKFDTWESDGQKRSKLSVVAENVQFLDRGDRDSNGSEPLVHDGSGSWNQNNTPDYGGGGGADDEPPF